MTHTKKIAWFSCGATSAVACKLALKEDSDVEVYYIETGAHHPDNKRFISECQEWFGKEINILQSPYQNVIDVIERVKFINSPNGASCTLRLKTRVRQQLEYENHIDTYYWGFESGNKEENRAARLQARYPEFKHKFPLIEAKLNKTDCLYLLEKQGIEIPEMYKLGYNNNNCIGCVKGGMGYWNKIRQDFPEVFKQMAEAERKIGHSCLKDYFLDELPLDAGRNQKELIPSCSIYCGMIDEDDE